MNVSMNNIIERASSLISQLTTTVENSSHEGSTHDHDDQNNKKHITSSSSTSGSQIQFFEWKSPSTTTTTTSSLSSSSSSPPSSLVFTLGTHSGFRIQRLRYESICEPYRSHVSEVAHRNFSDTEERNTDGNSSSSSSSSGGGGGGGVGICHLIFEQQQHSNRVVSGSLKDTPSAQYHGSDGTTSSSQQQQQQQQYPCIVAFVGGGPRPVSYGNMVNFFDYEKRNLINSLQVATEVVGLSSCVVQQCDSNGTEALVLAVALEDRILLYAVPITLDDTRRRHQQQRRQSRHGIGAGRGNLVSQLQKLSQYLVKEYPCGSGSRLSSALYSSGSSAGFYGPDIMETSRSMCKLMIMWEDQGQQQQQQHVKISPSNETEKKTYTSPPSSPSRRQYVLLAFPHVEKGKVQVEKFSLTYHQSKQGLRVDSALSVVFPAHESAISQIAVSPSGRVIATTSEKGTRIRVYSVNTTPSLLKDFKRGTVRAHIYSLVFSHDSNYLCCTSDRNTLHVYTLSPDKNQHYQALSQQHGYRETQQGLLDTMSTFLSNLIQESDIAQYRITAAVQRTSGSGVNSEMAIPSIASFHPHNPNIVNVLTGDGRLVVLYFNYDLENWIHMCPDYSECEQLRIPVFMETHRFVSHNDAFANSDMKTSGYCVEM